MGVKKRKSTASHFQPKNARETPVQKKSFLQESFRSLIGSVDVHQKEGRLRQQNLGADGNGESGGKPEKDLLAMSGRMKGPPKKKQRAPGNTKTKTSDCWEKKDGWRHTFGKKGGGVLFRAGS